MKCLKVYDFMLIDGSHKKKKDRGYSDTGGFIFQVEYSGNSDFFSDPL